MKRDLSRIQLARVLALAARWERVATEDELGEALGLLGRLVELREGYVLVCPFDQVFTIVPGDRTRSMPLAELSDWKRALLVSTYEHAEPTCSSAAPWSL